MTEAPDVSQATCNLCRPPQVIGAGILDHLRLFHPGRDEGGTPVTDPSQPFEYPVIDPLAIEREAVCVSCGRAFKPGDRYSSRPVGFIGDTPLTEVVCLPCEEGGDG
jgi:hypothetical protein